MQTSIAPNLRNGKRRIQRRLRDRKWVPQERPMFTARNIQYEVAERGRGLSAGGIGRMFCWRVGWV